MQARRCRSFRQYRPRAWGGSTTYLTGRCKPTQWPCSWQACSAILLLCARPPNINTLFELRKSLKEQPFALHMQGRSSAISSKSALIVMMGLESRGLCSLCTEITRSTGRSGTPDI